MSSPNTPPKTPIYNREEIYDLFSGEETTDDIYLSENDEELKKWREVVRWLEEHEEKNSSTQEEEKWARDPPSHFYDSNLK